MNSRLTWKIQRSNEAPNIKLTTKITALVKWNAEPGKLLAILLEFRF
jgi:hypothetical protein